MKGLMGKVNKRMHINTSSILLFMLVRSLSRAINNAGSAVTFVVWTVISSAAMLEVL